MSKEEKSFSLNETILSAVKWRNNALYLSSRDY